MMLSSWSDADRIMGTARNADAGKPIANNTRLYRRGEDYALRLHATDVVTYHPDGSVTLASGGWLTVTTKDRWKNFSPGAVYSDRGAFYLYYAGQQYPYADGITMHPDGTVTGAGELGAIERARQARKDAGRYARGYVDALYAGQIGAPSGGDCWVCLMFERGGHHSVDDHLRSHIDERYYVPSLVWNALQATGSSIAARETVRALQTGEHNGWGGIVRQQIERAIRRYVLAGLLPGIVAGGELAADGDVA